MWDRLPIRKSSLLFCASLFLLSPLAIAETQNSLSLTVPVVTPGASGSFSASSLSGPASSGSGTYKNTYSGLVQFSLDSGAGRYSTVQGAQRYGLAYDTFQLFRSFLTDNFLSVMSSNTSCPSATDYTWLMFRYRTPDYLSPNDMDASLSTFYPGGTLSYDSGGTPIFAGNNYFDLASLTNRTALSYGMSAFSGGCSNGNLKTQASSANRLLDQYGTLYFGDNGFVYLSSGGSNIVAIGLPKQTLSNGVMSSLYGNVFSGLYVLYQDRYTQTQKLIYATPDSAGTTFTLREATDVNDSSVSSALGTLTCTSLNSPANGFCSGSITLNGVSGSGNAVCHMRDGTGSRILSCAAQYPGDNRLPIGILATVPSTAILATTFSGIASVASIGNSTTVTATVRNITGRSISTMGNPGGGLDLSSPFTAPTYSGSSSTGGACGTTLNGFGTCTLSIPYTAAALTTTLQTLRVSYNNGSTTVSATAPVIGVAGLSSIAITPSTSNYVPGATQQFTATATYTNAATQDISSAVNWTSSNTGVATVASTPGVAGSGVVTFGGSAGSTTISAGFSGVATTGSRSVNLVDGFMFFSSTSANGDMGGPYFADYLCQYDATNAGLTGIWKAVVSTSSVNAVDRVTVNQAFYNLRPNASGGPQTLANNYTETWDGSLATAITYLASGASAGAVSTWSGTVSDGTYYTSNTCSDWSTRASTSLGRRGSSAGNWVDAASSSCDNSFRLVCINKQSAAAAPPNPTIAATTNVGRIALTFTSGGGTTAAYKLAYQTGASAPADCNSGTTVSASALGPMAKGYELSGLTNGTVYSFRLCAANSDLSQYSSGATLTSITVPASLPSTTQVIGATTTSYLGGFGSIYVADYLCQSAATAAGYSGIWKSLTSSSTTSALSRLSIDPVVYNLRPTGSGGGQYLKLNRTDFWQSIPNTVGYTIAGAANTTHFWTGTTLDGEATTNCSDWTTSSSGSTGTRGAYHTSATWLNLDTPACNNFLKLYCINQQSASAAPNEVATLDAATMKNGVALYWTSGGGTTAAYQISYASGNTAPATCSAGTVIPYTTVGMPGTAYVVPNLTATQNYSFRVCAVNSDGSAMSSGIVKQGVTIPAVTPSGTQQLFSTTNTYNGGIGSRYVADFICQSEAYTNSLTGIWKAMISDSTENAVARITESYPIVSYRNGGASSVILGNGYGTLFGGTLANAPSYGPDGNAAGTTSGWTASNPAGVLTGNSCSEWSSSSSSLTGRRGTNTSATTWLGTNTTNCNSAGTFLCVNGQSASGAPNELGSLTATAHINSVVLTWTSGGGTTAAYQIAYQTGTTAPADCNTGTVITPYTIGPAARGYVVAGLTPGTDYAFRVCAANSDVSLLSSGQVATTQPLASYGTVQTLFITNSTFTGNLGSKYMADFACQREADAAGMGGIWRALLSSGSDTIAAGAFTKNTTVVNNRGAGLGGPQLIANGYANLFNDVPATSMNYKADGTANGTTSIWTGSNADGTLGSATCSSWSTTSGSGISGLSTTPGSWLNYASATCGNARGLYCINQQSSSAAPANPASLTKTSATTSSILLGFTSGGGTTAAYRIAYQLTTPPADCATGTVVSETTLGVNPTSYNVTGLAAATTYGFRICAINSDATQVSSGTVLTTTTN